MNMLSHEKNSHQSGGALNRRGRHHSKTHSRDFKRVMCKYPSVEEKDIPSRAETVQNTSAKMRPQHSHRPANKAAQISRIFRLSDPLSAAFRRTQEVLHPSYRYCARRGVLDLDLQQISIGVDYSTGNNQIETDI